MNCLVINWISSRYKLAVKTSQHRYLCNSDSSTLVGKFTESGVAPLYIAYQSGSVDIMQLLLENGACINTSLKTRESPLFVAAMLDRKEVVMVLLQYNPEPMTF